MAKEPSYEPEDGKIFPFLRYRQRILKRAIDIVAATCAIIIALPIIILVAILIRLDSQGPIFFAQTRVGYLNRPFTIFKFRTVYSRFSDPLGVISLQPNDHRVTRVGRLLRGLHLDELPQLLNVIRGDMSLVGPRPHTLGSSINGVPFFLIVENYWHRHTVRPGIVGLAQMDGYRGPVPSVEHLKRRINLDLEYIRDWSITRDFMIIFRTIINIIIE
ncbi:sugar transferase [Qipengyuania gaetbuli]|uniref:sugar transferase n=1 Tax=Qipengyuania gaetbuli TaxID=266952 RepID=UPI001CFD25EE